MTSGTSCGTRGLAAVLVILSLVTLVHGQDRAEPVQAKLGRLPLYFVENQGLFPPEVAYYVRGADKTLFFTRTGLTIFLQGESQGWVVKVDFPGGRSDLQPRGEERQSAIFSHFTNRKADWKVGLATYAAVRYPDVWPGIDLVYQGSTRELKYEFVVKPGANPARIRMRYHGAERVFTTTNGALRVETPGGDLTDSPPLTYQVSGDSRREVDSAFVVSPAKHGNAPEVGFRVGQYDPARPLVIDPGLLVYCGFIGDADSLGGGIAVDASGQAYVTGATPSTSMTFPVKVGPNTIQSGGYDAFVAKVNAAGTELIYCGFIGGKGADYGLDIAVDSAGQAYVTGKTGSDENTFPVCVGPDLTFNSRRNSNYPDAFVAKVNASGKGLVYCGYIGGAFHDVGEGIAVDGAGCAVIAGSTESAEEDPFYEQIFPVKVGPGPTYQGSMDAFVARVNPGGTALDYCGYIGGTSRDEGHDVAVDRSGNAYVTGATYSDENSFPVRGGPDLSYNGRYENAFVAKVSAAGNGLVYCGYIGGERGDVGHGIAVDRNGNAYVTGTTNSDHNSFPVTGGPDLTYNDLQEAFVAKVKADPSAPPSHPDYPRVNFDYCGYIGGGTNDYGRDIAVDADGNAYVVGYTNSSHYSFPVKNGPGTKFIGNYNYHDVFVARVKADPTAPPSPLNYPEVNFDYCGYIGGEDYDYGMGIAVDPFGNAYVMGLTDSEKSFPVRVGPVLVHPGRRTAFVARIEGNSVEVVDAVDFVWRRGHIVDSNPDVLDCQGLGRVRVGAVADGESRLLLRVTTQGVRDVQFSLENPIASSGSLAQPGGMFSSSTPVIYQSTDQNPTGKHRAYCVFRAPLDFVSTAADENLASRKVNVLVAIQGGPTHTVEIQIHRPPVVLCHGLWSNRDTWKNQFQTLRDNHPLFTAYAVDYEETNAAGFLENSLAVRRGIVEALDLMHQRRIAATQVDWIGHSMGGILPRYYYRLGHLGMGFDWERSDNFGSGDIHKLILMNSPQWGSPWANTMVDLYLKSNTFRSLIAVTPFAIGGAHVDLREGSQAFDFIWETRIPTYTLVGVGGERLISAAGVSFGVASRFTPPPYRYVIRLMSWFTLATTKVVYRNQKHDTIVLENSQTAGLAMWKYGTIFDSGIHYHHVAVTGDPDYYNEVIRLLNASVSPTFCKTLPPPELNPVDADPGQPVTLLQNGIALAKPSPATPVKPGESVPVEVTAQGTFVPVEVDIFFDKTFVTLTQAPFHQSFTVPGTASGSVTVVAFARDASNQVAVAGPLVLPVQMPTGVTLQGLVSKHPSYKLGRPGQKVQLRILGIYSDQVQRDLTPSRAGTTYQVAPAHVVAVDAEGCVTVLGQGKATVTARNGSYATGISMEVVFPEVTRYGFGLKGTGGQIPCIGTGGESPIPGNANFRIEVTDVVGGAPGLLLLSFGFLDAPLFGGSLLVNPAGCAVLPVLSTGTPGKAGEGQVVFLIPVPSGSALVGLTTYWQAGFQDAGAGKGISLTSGLAVTVTP